MRYCLVFLLLIFPVNAYAYIDPGAGAFIFQVMIAFILGGLFTIKMYWKKIKVYLSNLFSKHDKEDEL